MLAAVRRQVPDKVPVTLAYGHVDDLCRQRGHPEMAGRLRQDQRTVSFHTRGIDPERIAGYVRAPLGEVAFDEWGIGRWRSSTGATVDHIHPLANVTSAREVEAYPFPDLSEPWRHIDLEEQIAQIHAQGLAAVGQMSQTVWETAMLMRGVDNLLMDLVQNEAVAAALIERITHLRCLQARRFAEAGIDILRLGDDVGTQRGLLMSPATWRRWLKPGLQTIIASATAVRPGLPIKYHSDGKIEPIIPDLIEAGVTILNPVQPEAMDPVAIKDAYGDRLAFWGTIGTQTTMPLGTPETVRATVRRMIETVGEGGGLVLAPTHSIERDVPWENILAFYEAADEYGAYQ